MFGKPEWFEFRLLGLSYRPTCWQGWAYVAVWTAVLLAPFWVLLFAFGRPLWSLIWLVWAVTMMMADSRLIYAKAQRQRDEAEWRDSDGGDARR